jgi:hypothetical protein
VKGRLRGNVRRGEKGRRGNARTPPLKISGYTYDATYIIALLFLQLALKVKI